MRLVSESEGVTLVTPVLAPPFDLAFATASRAFTYTPFTDFEANIIYDVAVLYTITPSAAYTSVIERNAVLPVTCVIPLSEVDSYRGIKLEPASVALKGPSETVFAA